MFSFLFVVLRGSTGSLEDDRTYWISSRLMLYELDNAMSSRLAEYNRYSSVMESQVNASSAGSSSMSRSDSGCREAANVHNSSPFLRM
jgi:hypothetical protein